MENVTIGLALVAGILSFISPCVLPLVPAYIGYMSGRLTHNVSRQTASGAAAPVGLAFRLQMLLHGIAFVLGFTGVFVLIGLLTTALASVAGQHVSTFTQIIGRIGGLVIIFFGFQFMGLAPRFFSWLRKKGQAGILDNVLLSIAFALVSGGIIYWGFLEQTIIALPLTAALALAMFVKGAFTQPAVFGTACSNGWKPCSIQIRAAKSARVDAKACSAPLLWAWYSQPAGRPVSVRCWAPY